MCVCALTFTHTYITNTHTETHIRKNNTYTHADTYASNQMSEASSVVLANYFIREREKKKKKKKMRRRTADKTNARRNAVSRFWRCDASR